MSASPQPLTRTALANTVCHVELDLARAELVVLAWALVRTVRW